ncbi:NADP-dependent oxidoreductase [Parachitinimonas caeni]|uniref:NADP-dependent oxidoreductase n=1 Tax=Parachitinimonas caeni TaxID=3031301 RepID=A0ABT7E185_9NEIS|nr:NADP-dependent oxidoreductase [Parachitinimonas caeni]MDK2126080.1 NADP-dependent oxidoreductase [Parachitinimonas caeni]
MYLESTREIHLASRPVGLPTAANFELITVPVRPLQAGEVLIKNLWMSVDPYMRGRMMDRESYVPPYKLQEALEGGAVGEVVESRSETIKVGDLVLHQLGWREHAVAPAASVQKIDARQAPPQAFLGVLGMTGMTAWAGLTRIAELKAGETVFVSAASGAVGAVAVQIAKQMGARVVASVGSDEKAAWLREIGADAVINYRTAGDLTAALRAAAPEGINVYFENVGGAHLEAALNVMKPFGRVIMCGMIEVYNATEPPKGPSNLAQVIGKRIKLQGMIVSDHFGAYPEFLKQVGGWLAAGKIQTRETVREGLDNAPDAFIGLFRGDNTGKMLVKLA